MTWRDAALRLAGFVAGAAIGAAAANANSGFYGGGYGYDSYAYAPAMATTATLLRRATATTTRRRGPTLAIRRTTRNYGYSGYDNYNTNYNGPMRERQLEGRDY